MSANITLPPSPVVPPFLNITNITRSNPMVVTVNTSNTYVPNQLAHFNIPASFGMTQLDQMTGLILTVDVTNLIFSVDIDSTQFDTFVIPGLFQEKPATLSSAGSRNLYNFQTVPFHSEGNFGN